MTISRILLMVCFIFIMVIGLVIERQEARIANLENDIKYYDLHCKDLVDFLHVARLAREAEMNRK